MANLGNGFIESGIKIRVMLMGSYPVPATEDQRLILKLSSLWALE